MAKEDLTITCPHCDQKQERVHPWVFAHWNETLIGTCEKCGKKFEMRSGKTRKAGGER